MAYNVKARMSTVTAGTGRLTLASINNEATVADAGYSTGDSVIYRIVSALGSEIGTGTYVVVSTVPYLDRATNVIPVSLDGRKEIIEFLEVVDASSNVLSTQDDDSNVVMYVEPTGNLRFSGSGKFWNDLRVPMTSLHKGGINDPGFALFKNDGSTSTGVFAYWFDATAEEELFFAAQLPHSWDGGSIMPHIHWTPSATADGDPANQKVVWGLEYTWADYGQAFPATTTIYGSSHAPADANVAIGKHYITPLSFPNQYIGQTPIFSGAGLNDLTDSNTGLNKGSAARSYVVIIDAVGTPDTFKWSKDGGAFNTGVSITGSAQSLDSGDFVITFGATTGHTLGNGWIIDYNDTPVVGMTPLSTQDGLSSMLVGRLFRLPTDSADTYEADAGLLEIDFHYSSDSLGSDEEYTK